ncbi:MAG: D-amino-acid transaminase [Thermoactinomyces vulgaris]|jgi:D-alanine transaminase|uniref:D-amino-acid transaminase n=1 Tax=Thermoactinomyces TaxID=2023 RepID=UPI0006739D56|nr:D-amino-acid transaminase [Thermoactinomyces vulgaris]QBK14378.1 D-amino-acid transaminase [Thermoactinomyces vulgaris]
MMILYNDQFKKREDVRIDIEDRAYQFGDGIYEVIRVYDGKPFYLNEHLERLEKSAKKIRLNLPYSLDELEDRLNQLIKQNDFTQGNLYLQVSRGTAPRNHAFPKNSAPLLIAYTQPAERPVKEQTEGIRAITAEDIRWLWCDVKSLNLLGAVLAKQEAYDKHCKEAIFIRDGIVTEGSSTNLFMVKDGMLLTHPADHFILHGITRKITLQLADQLQIPVSEKKFGKESLFDADEIFITSTTMEICPVVEVDGKTIGDGRPGPLTRQLQEAFKRLIPSKTEA